MLYIRRGQNTKDKSSDGQRTYLGRVELQIRIRDSKKSWEFHILNNMQYQCILGIDFMRESKLTLDFDKKYLIIPDDQIKQLPIVEKPAETDLFHTKLGNSYSYRYELIPDVAASPVAGSSRQSIDFMRESKLTLDFDKKYLIIPDDQIKQLPIVEKPAETDLSHTKLEKIELREDLKSRRGLAVSLEIICHNCGESTSTMSSKISNKCYDVNLRLTYGMRAIGKGGAAARIFCGLMNLLPPPAKFERHNSLFLNVLKTISEDSMNAAVHEAVIANDNNSNIAVAVDGTWHKKRLFFIERSLGNGMSGVLSIFQRSETSRKACYTQYLGDGDSKGFLTIKEAKVYGDTEVEKLECVGHVQKRMGTRLRNILKMGKGIKLSDGKIFRDVDG
ncbi:uncharacterized protein TNCV_1920121 [Trichonephila clavipes]|nr:uncharacterized protein TNCV_1920121 [Trichonephila clavipes]